MCVRIAGLALVIAAWTADRGDAQVTPTTLPDLPADAVPMAFEPVGSGGGGALLWGPPDSSRLVIRTSEAWAEFWAPLGGLRVGPSDPPRVDFDRDMVLVAAMGQRRKAGYRISIEGVYASGSRLYVDVLEVSPGVACLTAQAVTAPMAAAAVPHSDGPVEFMERSERGECS